MNIPLSNGAMFVSSSFLDTLVCPRASQYYKINARVGDRGSTAMIFGQHLHSALSLYYRLQEYNLEHDTIMSRVSTLLEMEFASHPTDQDDWRNLNWAMETFLQLVQKYRDEEFQVVRYKEARPCAKCNGKGSTSISEQNIMICGMPCLWCNGTGLTSVMSEIPFAVKLFDYHDHGIAFNNPIPIYYHRFSEFN